MSAPVVLPFQITCAILLIALVATPFVFRRAASRAMAIVAAFVLFIPSCTAVMLVVDQFRYGRFEYATAAEVPTGGYLEFPASATDIVVESYGAGHKARFNVGTDELRDWIVALKGKLPEYYSTDGRAIEDSPEQRSPQDVLAEYDRRSAFEQTFAELGWSYDPAMVQFSVTRNTRGGGYTIWHLSETGETYLRGYYF
ncbi:MAG: hypothetical protein M3552_22040 [Planctomycetota bacterium]|nr:hypothetical protein [Planctomycetota bacterium]